MQLRARAISRRATPNAMVLRGTRAPPSEALRFHKVGFGGARFTGEVLIIQAADTRDYLTNAAAGVPMTAGDLPAVARALAFPSARQVPPG